MELIARKAANGEVPQHQVMLFGIFFSIPIFTDLSLVSCLLSVIVDSMDNLRDLVDRYDNCFPRLFALLSGFLSRCPKRLSNLLKGNDNHAHNTDPEAGLEQNSS